MGNLIERTERGLYCEKGGFYIDPWKAVEKAIITHAHGDHAKWGCSSYLTSEEGKNVLQARVGETSNIETLKYGNSKKIRDVEVTLFPAGHILGSSQIRVSSGRETWVISGDYKVESDATCTSFEVVPCNVFITESTFGLPIYQWQNSEATFGEINTWWNQNASQKINSIIFAYALGKSQRLLSGLDPTIGPIVCHGLASSFNKIYRDHGIKLPETLTGSESKLNSGNLLVIAPPSVQDTPWLKKYKPYKTAFASGWMAIRGNRRRRNLDRGFVMSDHSDWPGLLSAIKATGAEKIGVTHGYVDSFSKYLKDQGMQSWIVPTHFEGEREEEPLSESPSESVSDTEKKP